MKMHRMLIAALLTLGLSSTATAQQVKEFRLGSPWPSTSTVHAALPVFAAAVERESKGSMKIRVYPDNQLGDIQALINGVQLGTIDMTYLAIGNANVLKGGGALNVAYVPYLFKSKAGAEKIANSPIFQELYDNLAKESGVRIFAVYGARSPRAIQNRVRPIRKPEDLKGLKIRIPPIDGIRVAFESMGAKPVVLGLGDTYNAIDRGQVDGHENGIDAAVGYKWYEVAKFFSQTNHIFETGAFYINEKRWGTLTKEEQEILINAAREGGAAMTAAGDKVDEEGQKILVENKVEITTPDQAAFENALNDVYKRFEGKVWPAGLVERIRQIPQ